MKHFIGLLFLLLLLACNTGADPATPLPVDSVEQDGTVLNDTPVVDTPVEPEEETDDKDTVRAKPPKPVTVPSPRGVYRAVLPCGTDCKGVQHTVAFYPDKTYRLEELRWDKDSTFTKTEGYWIISNGLILLYKEQLLAGRYRWKGDTLLYLQTSKPTALHRLTPASANEAWSNKKREGLTFFGVGNEPFWSLEIGRNKTITFHLAEWEKPKEFQFGDVRRSADSILYTTTGDSATLQVVIYNTFCSDGMSDYIYDNKVKVQYNTRLYRGCGLLYRQP